MSKALVQLEAVFRSIAEATSGKVSGAESLGELRLDCELFGRQISAYVSELKTAEGDKIAPDLEGVVGSPILGLWIHCPIEKNAEFRIYKMFVKPLLHWGMKRVKTGDPDCDRRVYILAKNPVAVSPIVLRPDFQQAVKSAFERCDYLEAKEGKLVFRQSVRSIKMDASFLKSLMESMAKLAICLSA